MKRLIAIAAMAALAGCQFAMLESDGDGKWKAKVCSHMFSRQFERFAADKKSAGEFSLQLNGYKGDTSEQLPIFTKETLYGAALLARIAAVAYNPAASGVPLDASAANADEMAKLVKANAEAKAELEKAKAEAAALKLEAQAKAEAAAQTAAAQGSSACANGECEAK
jgi:hypothetical protein